ncbi:DUF6493 family protein [Capnocytophaga sp. CM59]|uniref:DUF6493 family protein n=1 Tax=Capnocytophaga sp. CM59 TaxID=936370 RepID=UPI00027C65B9|nr:DUF6493 family protein [Capnocytophaga sp. CM59]EJU26766.1 hypothetical protein HMPREF1154_1477 [Capnocytophaga sp. CM59]
MKENLLSAIKAHDFNAIRTICFGLSQEERLKLKVFFLDTPITQMYDLPKSWAKNVPNDRIVMAYAFMCLSDQREEILHFERKNNICPWYAKGVFYDFLSTAFYPELLALIQAPQGAYLKEELPQMYVENAKYISFEMLWVLYKMDLIPFNEKLFVENFYHKNVSYREEPFFIDLLLQYPEIATQILAAAPKYIYTYLYDTEYILAMYHILAKNNYFTNRDIVKQYLQALLNPWKKNILNAYCRWIEAINPTADEVIENQYILFSILSLGNTALINFAMKQLQKAANASTFDFQSFADNFTLCFAIPKIAKSQLIGLDILEKYYKKQAPTNTKYREQLAVLFTVPEVILQEKVAGLLTTYFAEEGLAEVVAPYRDYLKIPTPVSLPQEEESLNKEAYQDNISSSFEERFPLEVGKLQVPTTADALLFLLGDCLRERTAGTIDLFFEGLIQLQERLPANYTKELAPYLKKLMKSHYLDSVTTIIKGFLYCYSHQKPLEIPPYQYTYEESNALREKLDEAAFEAYLLWGRLYNHKTFMPFLFHKAQLTLKYLNEKEVLPFLSTPTHEPFYIEAEIFVDKLLQYEAVNKQPDLHDLIVACNRLLFRNVSAAAKAKAQKLKGTYAPAIQYYLGITDKIQPTEELLPLWTQITRIKHPDREFPEFETTSAKEIPSVVKPYYIGYGWTKWRDRDIFTFHNYDIGYDEKSEKGYWIEHYRNSFSPLYYNACGGSTPLSTEVNYLLSLNPHYPDAILCGYIANNACGAEEIRNMQLPLEAILRYDLRMRHSGWLYIGACLLYDKRPSRDLAYEYILQALTRGEDLHYVGRYLSDALAMHFSPINRFVEFLDRPTRDPKVKAFQRKVVALYLEEVKKQEKLPRYHKKLAAFGD